MSIRINVGTTFDAKDLQRAQRELDALKANADTLGNRMTALGGKFEKVGGQIAGVGKSLTAKVTAPIIGLGAASLAAFSSVEEGIAEVGKATGATGDDLARFGDNLRSVLRRVPEDAKTVGSAMGDLNTRLGVTGDELETVTKQALEFARVNNADVGESVAVLGKLLNAMEMDASDAESVMDKLTFAAQKTGISATRLGQNILDAGPAFEELGFGMDKSIALFASFEAAGARPEEVIGSLNLAINRMAKDAGKLDELERGLISPSEMFDELLASIKDAPDILAATTLASEAFGSRVGAKVAEDIRAGRFEVDAFAEEVANVEGVVSGTAEATETFKDRMAILKNETLLVGEAFGETLLPFVEQGLEKFRELTKRFQELSPEQREQIVRFAALAAAIGPALIIVGKLVAAFGTLIKTAVVLGKGILLLFTPMGAIVAAIAAVIAIGVLLWRNWDTVKEKASDTWSSVANAFSRAWEGMKSVAKNVANFIIGYYNAILSGIERAINGIANAINRIPKFTAPSWVPGIGGQSFGMPSIPNVSFPRIPALAEGGIVRDATLALIGEAGPEAVIPLDRLGETAGGGPMTVNVTVTSADPRAVVDAIRRYTRSNGPLGQVVNV
jgi:TP901 family phage tail tape measure protein